MSTRARMRLPVALVLAAGLGTRARPLSWLRAKPALPVAGAPLMLLMHALPQTDGLARLWWRGMVAALGVQVAQALVLATAVRVFFTSGGREALGLSVTGNLIDLLVCLCLFWILIKIPFWAKDLAFSPGRSTVTQIARSFVMAKGVRAL